MRNGVTIIADERARQMGEEGWTPEHDDTHTEGELALAAACYAWPRRRPLDVKKAFPWPEAWKPELALDDAARIRVLAKAGALIAAEIDRLQRIAVPAHV